MIGNLFAIESLSTFEGEGVRYTVFLSGCPLFCAYCHNIDHKHVNKEIDHEDLVKKILRYKPYFGDSGGVTFSGGEPLIQSDFILKTAESIEKFGINFNIDTSGALTLSKSQKEVLRKANHVFLDIKETSAENFFTLTGGKFENVLKTLDFLDMISKPTTIRTVVANGICDTIADMEKLFQIVKDKKCVTDYILLPFHTLGFSKYDEYSNENKMKDEKPMDAKVVQNLQNYLNQLLSQTN